MDGHSRASLGLMKASPDTYIHGLDATVLIS